MSRRFPFVGIARCRTCSQEFAMRSGSHEYCKPACRLSRVHPVRQAGDPRTFNCIDCTSEGRAGKSGPLPRRCEPCRIIRNRQTSAARARRRYRRPGGAPK